MKTVEWIDLPFSEARKALAAHHFSDLDTAAYAEALPRYESIPGGHLIVTRYFLPGQESLTAPLLLIFNDQVLITLHGEPSSLLNRLSDPGRPAKGPAGSPTIPLIAAILLEVVFSYEAPLDEAEEKANAIETMVFNNDNVPHAIHSIYVLKSQLAVMNRLHRLTIDLVGKLIIHFGDAPLFQNVLSEAETSFQFSSRMLDNLHHLVNVQISLASHRTNEIVRVLTIFSVFFMPLTFIAGIYGMNFQYLPELKWKYGYPACLLLMVLVAAGTFHWFRRKRWL